MMIIKVSQILSTDRISISYRTATYRQLTFTYRIHRNSRWISEELSRCSCKPPSLAMQRVPIPHLTFSSSAASERMFRLCMSAHVPISISVCVSNMRVVSYMRKVVYSLGCDLIDFIIIIRIWRRRSNSCNRTASTRRDIVWIQSTTENTTMHSRRRLISTAFLNSHRC